MTLAEISDAVNKQKLTSEIVDKFFEDSKPQDITMKFSDISRYISDQKRLGIENLLVSFFFNKRGNRMMMFTDIGAGMTLTEISEFIGKHTHDAQVANNFFGIPVTSKTTLSDIDMFMARQITLDAIVDKFLGDTPLTAPTLAEIKSAIDKQKLTSEIVDKFFEDSKPGDITTKISDIDKYVRDRDQLKIRSLLIPFFFDKEANRIMTDNEIKANYLDVYTDIFKLKEDLTNVQKPINDLVGKFFGTTPVNTTLASISEFINKHTHSTTLLILFLVSRLNLSWFSVILSQL